MTRFQFTIGILLTLSITIAAGAMHGRLSGRWGASEAANQAAKRLELVPTEFGPWKIVRRNTLDQSSIDQLRPLGYIDRTYINVDSGQRVTVCVLAGPVGRTAVHTPEVCYTGRAFTIEEAKTRTQVNSGGTRTDQFWAMTFRNTSLEGGLLRVYYAWSDGTSWEATSNGRFKFAGLPYLYKIELAAELPRNDASDSEDPCERILHDLIPELRKHMIAARD